jgi:hypothetical protein
VCERLEGTEAHREVLGEDRREVHRRNATARAMSLDPARVPSRE